MSSSLIQRAVFAALRLNPVAARASRWLRAAWRADPQGYERLIIGRLNHLVRHFAGLGLYRPPAGGLYPADRLADVAHWPVLEREALRELFPRLKALFHKDRRYTFFKSGGSTGEPTQLYRLKTTGPVEQQSLLHMLGILGWRPGTLRVCLWGSPRDLGLRVDSPTGLKGWLGSQMANRKAIGGYAPAEPVYFEFVDYVEQHPGCAVYGFAGLLEECARLMQRDGRCLKPGAISALWGTSEMLHPHQREAIGQAFGLPVRDLYGSRECPWVSAECEHGTRHVNPRYLIEVVDSARNPVPAGATGELCLTDLFNTATPLIRYMVGDMGAVEWRNCACGRNGLVLASLQGRVHDVIRLPSGRMLSSVFYPQLVRQYPGIRNSQLVRAGAQRFIARYTGSLSEDGAGRIARLISEVCEGARVDVEQVEEIPLTAHGKLLYYVDER